MAEKTEESRGALAAGWEAILERSRRWKIEHLASDEFIDLDEAAERLGAPPEPLEGRLLVLPTPLPGGPPRVPIWALPLAGETTEALLNEEPDAWALYSFLDAPDGVFSGRRPRDLLPARLLEVLELLRALSPPR